MEKSCPNQVTQSEQYFRDQGGAVEVAAKSKSQRLFGIVCSVTSQRRTERGIYARGVYPNNQSNLDAKQHKILRELTDWIGQDN